jgi:hypothetical protein
MNKFINYLIVKGFKNTGLYLLLYFIIMTFIGLCTEKDFKILTCLVYIGIFFFQYGIIFLYYQLNKVIKNTLLKIITYLLYGYVLSSFILAQAQYYNCFNYQLLNEKYGLIIMVIQYFILIIIWLLFYNKSLLMKIRRYLMSVLIISGACFLVILFSYESIKKGGAINFRDFILIIFNDHSIRQQFEIETNLILQMITYILFFMIINSIFLYINNADSKMISFILYKQTIKNNILKILTKNIAVIIILFSSMMISFGISYVIIYQNLSWENSNLIIIYLFKLSLVIYLIIILYELMVVLNKEILSYYLSIFTLMTLIYLDINKKSSFILISNNINDEIVKVLIMIFVILFSSILATVLYKHRRDLL